MKFIATVEITPSYNEMATDLEVQGPFDVIFTEGKAARLITPQDKAAFVAVMEKHGVAEKHGCYVFALRSSKGYTPWYVGKAARPLAKECMGSHQLNKYQQVFALGIKGTPVMFFVCPEGTKKKVAKDVVDEVEDELIMYAAKRNEELLNIQKRAEIGWSIQGILHGSGKKLSAEEKDFKAMMGIVNSRDTKKQDAVSRIVSALTSPKAQLAPGQTPDAPPTA